MYICPECKREFGSEEGIKKHFLACWREEHPGHKSKDAPSSNDIITRQANDDVFNFFRGLQS